MNHIYRSIWNDKTGTFVAASENAKSGGNKSSPGATVVAGPVAGNTRFVRKGLALSLSLMLAFGSNVYAGPTGGAVSAGSASIAGGAGKTTISQSSQNVAINWQGFNIGQTESVQFVQPNSNSVALNRVLGSDPSSILGSLSANGKVFLLNPNGILFGQGAQVNVGGLVASTLNITDDDFMAGRYNFSGTSKGTILNQGSINADGGYVALLGANLSNEGVISAKLGTVALAAGNAMTLDIAGDGLLNVMVNQGAVNALVQNGGLIRADGGQVLLTAQAAGNLLQSVVNNTGVIQAQTVENHNGMIRLLGDMQSGSVNVSGKLDASAPNGGDGGFIETSAAHVKVADNTIVTTQSAQGKSGTWLIDPPDFTISAAAAGTIAGGNPSGDVSGSTLTTALGSGNVTILSNQGSTAGIGDINVNDAVSWNANLLTLNAVNNINVNAVMNATGTASLALNPGTGTVVTGRDSSGNFTGRVDFSGAGTLSIGGTPYTVINSLGGPGSNTGADLQGMKGSLATNYALGSNIVATDTSNVGLWGATGFTPVGITGTLFTGKFDGLGHTITGLTIKSGAPDAGLFGASAPTSAFSNVGLVLGSVVGAAGSGGLVGTNAAGATVSNSYNTGSVTGAAGTGGLVGKNAVGSTISNSYTTGTVTGAAGTGGLVGSNLDGSAISNSYSTSVVVGSGAGTGGLVGSNTTGEVSKSYASGSVKGGGADTGGLLGSNTTGPVSDSYATGNVSGNGAGVGGLIGTTTGTVTHSYSTGSVTTPGGGSNMGALVGVAGAGAVTFSFWNTDTSALASAGGGIGMTTAQMQAQANFTLATLPNGSVNPNWNFTTTWVMYEGSTYPLLRPFMTPLTVTANNDIKTYNGVAYAGGHGVTPAPNGSNLLGTPIYSGTSQTAINAGSYVITPGGLYSNQQGYIISYANNGTLTIGKAPLTATVAAPNKVYDGTTTAAPTLSITAGLVIGETVTATGTATFNTKDVPTANLVTVNTTALADGTGLASNYSLAPGQTVAATITPKALTMSGLSVPASKIYDGNTAAVVGGGPGSLAAAEAPGAGTTADGKPYTGDTVSITGTANGTYNSKNVATATTVTYGGLSLTGAENTNYSLTIQAPGAAAITPLNTNISGTRVYDGSATAVAVNVGTVSALLGSDTVTVSGTGSVADKNVAVGKAVTNGTLALGGTDAGNYNLLASGNTMTVTPAPLTVKASDATKTYGQTPTLFAFTTPVAPVNGETVGSVTETSPGTVATAPVAGSPYLITPSSATGGTFTPSNYLITYLTGLLAVTPLVQPIPIVVPPVIPPVVTPPDVAPPVEPAPVVEAPETPPVEVAAETPEVQQTVQDTLSSSPLIRDSVGKVSRGELAGLNLTVIGAGVRMPPMQLAETPPAPVLVPPVTPLVQPPPVVVPPEMPPQIYVPPQRPRKPDRN